ncbi:MAG: hypothetical protein EXS03_04560 [Phycisphaerales bacterium]|nr:hypothetical protein [Phycisphaerales bacterium]
MTLGVGWTLAAGAVLAAATHTAALAQGLGEGAIRTAENLQRQLNFEDAQMRKAFFAGAPMSERLAIDYGGTFRYAFNLIDQTNGIGQYLQQFDLRVFTDIELDGAHRFYGRLRFLYDDWDFIGPSFNAQRDEGWQNPVAELYWYQFDLAGLIESQTGQKPDYNFNAKMGRQYVIWAQGGALSDYMYAGLFELSWRDIKATVLIGETAGADTVDWDLSRPGYDSNTERLYYGCKVEYSGITGHRPFAYILAQKDLNAGQVSDLPVGIGGYPTSFNYNSTYLGLGATGALSAELVYRAEFMYEYGTTLSDPLSHSGGLVPVPQQDVNISALAGFGGVTWLARDASDTRLDFQIVAGSGSSARLDSGNTFGGIAPNSLDTSFNSLGYVNTGLVLSPDFANLLCPSVGASTTPFPGGGALRTMRLGITAFAFARLNTDAPLSFSTVPGGSNFVGSEIDFSVEWRFLSDMDLNLRYGMFLPNMEVFFPGQTELQDLLYAGITYAF